MKYLKEQYWKSFNSKIPSEKGKKFEKLIKKVLDVMYGESTWTRTKDSWDGSKDFYYYSIESKMWAECKNYASSIGLKVVSPSLVMAKIYDIDTLLFFSYSAINDNTKSKIAKYADKTFLKVKFFDDETLEKLLFNYWHDIGNKYFKKYKSNTVSYISEPIIKQIIYKNPLLDQTECLNNEIEEMKAYHMFEIDICIINRNDTDLSAEISFDNLHSKDLQYFDVTPFKLKKSPETIVIPAYESSVYKIYMSPMVGGQELNLPKILINGKNISFNKEFLLRPIKCKISKENRLIGEKYNEIVSDFNDNIMQNKIAFTLFGGSGVGKSRLFAECVKKCIVKDYILLNYSAAYHSTNRLNDAENLIKGIIIALYDLTNEEILNMFYKIAINPSVGLDTDTLSAFRMIKAFLDADTSFKYKILIDKYIDIICQKLGQRKYLIAIDNIQFFDESIAYFLHKIISNRINSRNRNGTIFLLTFNTDYIKPDSLCMDLLLFLKENNPLLEKEKIIGFQSDKECEVYLQETLAIGTSMDENNIDAIIKKTDRNPFYLEQMVSWLYEKKILEIKNGNYFVKKPEELLEKINEIPKEISEIIEQRWSYFIASNTESAAVLILSAIYFYTALSKQDAISLRINWNMIVDMEKSGFLSITSDDIDSTVVFYHDIIEKFFSNKYFPLCKKICDYESETNLKHQKSKYQQSLFDLYENETMEINVFREKLSLDLPVKLAGEFYSEFYKYYINYFDEFSDKSQWIVEITQLMGKIRDCQGNEKMLLVAKKTMSLLTSYDCSSMRISYGRFLLTISETLDSIGEYKKAHDIIYEYKNKIESNDNSIEEKRFLSELYNRLHVYRRHQCIFPLQDSLAKKYINKAIQLSKETEFCEMEYVNNSDLGYLYYNLPASDENAQYTLQYWEKARKVFQQFDMSSKTLNYIRKCVQIELLHQSSEKAICACREGLSYIDNGKYSYQKLFFKWWFSLAMSEGYLQDIVHNNLNEVNKCLNNAQEYADLLKTNKKYYVLFLRAIYFYYEGNTKKAVEYFTSCSNLLAKSSYISKTKILLEQTEYNLEMVLNQNNHDNEKQLISQITTKDGLFNLICL